MTEQDRIEHAKTRVQESVLARVDFSIRQIRGRRFLVCDHAASGRKDAVRVEDAGDGTFKKSVERIIDFLKNGK